MITDMELLTLRFLNQLKGFGLLGVNGPKLRTRSTRENPSFSLDCQFVRGMWRLSGMAERFAVQGSSLMSERAAGTGAGQGLILRHRSKVEKPKVSGQIDPPKGL